MSFPLNNIATADSYTDANTLRNQAPCVLVQLHVFNAAILYQLQIGGSGREGRDEPFRPEVFLAPGFHHFYRRLTGCRVRSAKAGTPAQVTVNLIPDDELPYDTEVFRAQ